MRKLYILLFALLAIGCSQDTYFEDDSIEHNGAATFIITNSGGQIEEATTRVSPQPIGKLIYAIFDSNDRLVRHAHNQFTDDFSSLTVEGLRDGEYTIVFVGATDKSAPLIVSELTSIDQKWIENSTLSSPINNDYLYKRQPFVIESNNSSRSVAIQLERSVGKVKVNLNAVNNYSKIYITKVEISYNEGSSVSTHQLVNGTHEGEDIIHNFEITNSLEFYSLPSTKKLSGTVKITALRSDKSIFVDTYKFSDAEILAGKESVIDINWSHPEDKMGKFNVRVQDFNATNSMTMFLDGESRDKLTSVNRRFYVNDPLQLSIDNDNKLCIRFFSAVPINDVTILCQFPKISNEFFELAHYEQISAFHESHMSIPVVSGSAIFKSEDGRLVEIPAQPNLQNNDCRIKFKTDDPYMQKIATIVPRWSIYFSHYDAATSQNTSWRFMTPEFCRQGIVLTTNMAFMFSSNEFKELLDINSGKLLDDNRDPIADGEIIRRINAHEALRMGLVEGVQGLGGGATYGIASYRYRDHYWDYAPRSEIRTTQFHEFSHCIGYGHNSDMTYGSGLWNVLCSQLMWDMGNAGKLLVNSKTVLNPQ